MSGLDDKGREESRKQIGAETLNAHMRFIALLGSAANGSLGDAGVILEDVETRFLGKRLFSALGDSSEIVQVQAEALRLR